MKTPIEVKDIRKGDKVRVERDPEYVGLPLAIEYHATHDGDRRFGEEDNPRHYLLDRPTPPVELPTDECLALASWCASGGAFATGAGSDVLGRWRRFESEFKFVPLGSLYAIARHRITAIVPVVAVPKAALDTLREYAANSEHSRLLSDFLAVADAILGGDRA